MDKYKKKSLNFMGFSRELRKTEIETRRDICRLQRFSIIRTLDDESITEENNTKESSTNSKIPKIGKQKDQANSRVKMLQNWKQEKMLKKQQESKLKKPVFKVGFSKPNPLPSLGSKPLFALDTSSRLFRSSFQVSNLHVSVNKQGIHNTSNTKTKSKVSNSQTQKPDVDIVNLKTSAKDMKIQSSISKTIVPSKSDYKLTRNKESGIRIPNTKPIVDTKSKVANKGQVSSNIKLSSQISKPTMQTKSVESRLQPLNARSKVTSSVKDQKSNIPSSGLPKTTASRTLSTKTKQIPSSGLPKATASRTLGTEPKQTIPKKVNTVKSIPKFSQTVASQQKGNISEKTSKSESKEPSKPESDCLKNKPNNVATFECELSHIEPVKETRKSFAPPGFQFQPPIELNSSLFLEDGPSAIFLRMKNQFLRTSTPKQSPSSEKSRSETEDNKCLENEDIKCAKNEDMQCPKEDERIEDAQCSNNAKKKLESSHKYDLADLLSSSLESVYLNDVKPIDGKKSLEIVSTQNQEVLLSSEITHSEPFPTTEIPGGEINPPILPDSVEIDKTEIIPYEITPTEDKKIAVTFPEVDYVFSEAILDPTYTVKPIDCKHSPKFVFPEICSTNNQEKVLLSPNVIHPEHSLATESIPNGENLLILPDSRDETEINSTNAEEYKKIVVPFSEVYPIIPEVIHDPVHTEPDENTENDQSVLNRFLQKKENGVLKIPERKIRNFRRSEKPGLSSINESLENTPKSALKKKMLDSVFTPRRSLRLAKLSGNFSSLENLLDTPKPKEMRDKVGLKEELTPRRSLRLSKFSTEYSSAENLFEIRRPTLYGTPEKDEVVAKISSRVTYDFDRLSSEIEEEARPHNTRGGKVSLLYSPSRPSIMRNSIKGDLMSFSPSI